MARRRSRRSRGARSTRGPGTTGTGAGTSTTTITLTPWRDRVRALLAALRQRARSRHEGALQALLRDHLGADTAAHAASDVDRLVDDWIVSSGSAGDGRSLVTAFAAEAADLEPLEREQLRRWERERHRGVFLVQRAGRDALEVWDPLEGAPLTLHLLDRLTPTKMEDLGRGAVVTASFQPWVARLVAVGPVEIFEGADALDLFRREVIASGRSWHEAPPPAPTRS
jgi:hypothetical protein